MLLPLAWLSQLALSPSCSTYADVWFWTVGPLNDLSTVSQAKVWKREKVIEEPNDARFMASCRKVDHQRAQIVKVKAERTAEPRHQLINNDSIPVKTDQHCPPRRYLDPFRGPPPRHTWLVAFIVGRNDVVIGTEITPSKISKCCTRISTATSRTQCARPCHPADSPGRRSTWPSRKPNLIRGAIGSIRWFRVHDRFRSECRSPAKRKRSWQRQPLGPDR